MPARVAYVIEQPFDMIQRVCYFAFREALQLNPAPVRP
jgi:hypothetical protein